MKGRLFQPEEKKFGVKRFTLGFLWSLSNPNPYPLKTTMETWTPKPWRFFVVFFKTPGSMLDFKGVGMVAVSKPCDFFGT